MNSNIQLLIPAQSNVDHSAMMLGKAPVIQDKRTLKLGNYLQASALPKLPDTFIWNANIDKWGVMKNDVIGDCTIAAAGHLIMGWNNDLGVSVNSNADNPTTNTTNGGGVVGVINSIEKEAVNLLANKNVQYALAGVGFLFLAGIVYTIVKRK